MTAQPPDLLGPNAWLVDEMYEQFRQDPSSVSDSWREFFEGYRPGGANLVRPPVPAPPPVPQATPLRGAAARVVANMRASLEVPTATSFRVVPAKLLEVNRKIL